MHLFFYTGAILYRCCMFRHESHPLYGTDYVSCRDKIGNGFERKLDVGVPRTSTVQRIRLFIYISWKLRNTHYCFIVLIYCTILVTVL